MESPPVIDLAHGVDAVAEQIDVACRDTGFFFVVGHGVPAALLRRLDASAREFFALGEAEKSVIAMRHGGRAWRGWFPVGAELTSGRPDQKEGLYFGQERPPSDLPLHGPNLFPARPASMREAVLEYMRTVTELGQRVLSGMALALGLDRDWFAVHLTSEPLVLFRIFHYPPLSTIDNGWSVGEHTDYGLITILAQDTSGGLEVRGRDGWIDVPPIPDAFVVNLGDMLERMTGGRYKSTPHRVHNTSGVDRLSFPLFLDPAWDAEVLPVPVAGAGAPADVERWDGANVHE
ncbi:MAG TPA: 2-oxoglutarate and iron-dependent oxygenase domain-containing protein, partial [Acidimicrobiales bacterium]|nr:2-oxoglutarate and iron-dependent oxygenase domain-containing protein [Acidimicrobiales bacterium]